MLRWFFSLAQKLIVVGVVAIFEAECAKQLLEAGDSPFGPSTGQNRNSTGLPWSAYSLQA
jgi:hypothetical protein